MNAALNFYEKDIDTNQYITLKKNYITLKKNYIKMEWGRGVIINEFWRIPEI